MRISKYLFYVIKRGANECVTADGTSTNEGLMCERDIKNMCVLVCSNMHFLFSLFVTHLDQTPINQLWPRPILIKSSKVNIMLVQYCNITVYCTPFSLFLFTVHWHIYTKQLLRSLCSWMWPERGFSAHIRFFLVWLFSWAFKCGPYQHLSEQMMLLNWTSHGHPINRTIPCLNSLPTMTETLG